MVSHCHCDGSITENK
uniref:Uncharacterized protein n=1 Tax=Arundo donax TaxID=35708 RepID=A0A0A9C894_ARUDO